MSTGTIILIHGTGVRLAGFSDTYALVNTAAQGAGIEIPMIGCAWGDVLGADFAGLSLPEPQCAAELESDEKDYVRWSYLFSDPLFELDRLTIPDASALPVRMEPPGSAPAWKELWNRINAYVPSKELELLLQQGGLSDYWPQAWNEIVRKTDITEQAFQQSSRELPEASGALARALVASLHIQAIDLAVPGPTKVLRNKLIQRLIVDWDQRVYGPGTIFKKLLSRAATRLLRADRQRFSNGVTAPIGDILLYQSRGTTIRDFIRDKILTAEGPVTLVAHSLGGVAAVDLLAMPDAPVVSRLITLGSQAPYLYEIGALTALKPPVQLPPSFPRWLNVYDRNDFLSFVAGRLFPGVEDFEALSGQPFPDAHSAYLTDPAVWEKIKVFIA